MKNDNQLSVLERCARGNNARACVEAALRARPALGSMTPSAEESVRQQALAEFAAEEGVTVSDLAVDLQVVDALTRISEYDWGIFEALLDGVIEGTPEEVVIGLGRLDGPTLQKVVQALRETLGDGVPTASR